MEDLAFGRLFNVSLRMRMYSEKSPSNIVCLFAVSFNVFSKIHFLTTSPPVSSFSGLKRLAILPRPEEWGLLALIR